MFYSNFGKKSLTAAIVLFSVLFQFSNGAFAAENDLTVEEAYPVWANKIEIIFSNEIAESSLSEDSSMFRLEDITSPNETYEVVNRELDTYEKDIMILTFDKSFINGHEYKLVVLSVEDIFGQNITIGVDAEASFTYRSDDYGAEEGDLNSAGEENNNNNDDYNNENNNIPEDTNNNENQENNNNEEGNLGGISLNAGDVENQVDVIANDNSKLPTAGAEHILVLLLALVLGGGILFFNYKRS